MKLFQKFARQGKLVLAGAIVAVAIAAAGTIGINAKAYAASCDDVNIIRCGLNGTTEADYITSLRNFYNKDSDNGHNDLQAVYNWAGISDADMSNMSTANSKMGTLYRNGDVKIDGEVVATDAWVSARFTQGDGFVKIKDGVWARKTTTSLEHNTYKVLVHYNSNGTVNSVVMVDCGNAVKVTPVKPKPTPPPAPKPALKCVSLRAAANSSPRTYTFTATGSASNTKIESYVFDFGDGQKRTVSTSSTKATTTYTYPAHSKSYMATVVVNSTDIKNVNNTACAASITTPPAPVNPDLVCDKLTFSPVANKPLTYKFTATATPTKTTITNYVFNFGDGKSTPVTTSARTASTEHTYAENSKTFTATVAVNSKDKTNVTSATCKVTVETPKPDECKPGIPKGDARCNECKPGIPVGDARCIDTPDEVVDCVPTDTQDENCVEQPTELVNSGPGAVAGLFAGTSLIGAAAHRIIRSRLSRQ